MVRPIRITSRTAEERDIQHAKELKIPINKYRQIKRAIEEEGKADKHKIAFGY